MRAVDDQLATRLAALALTSTDELHHVGRKSKTASVGGCAGGATRSTESSSGVRRLAQFESSRRGCGLR